mgnify:CR=1 FL=1
MSSAALTNSVVMMATEGIASLSPATASCKLHDEQLPQSPTLATKACHCFASSMMSASAGAL